MACDPHGLGEVLGELVQVVVDSSKPTTTHAGNRILEAECGTCGETFNPDHVLDVIHVAREDGQPCGGTGTIRGEWLAR